jgi:hypothetical protein
MKFHVIVFIHQVQGIFLLDHMTSIPNAHNFIWNSSNQLDSIHIKLILTEA